MSLVNATSLFPYHKGFVLIEKSSSMGSVLTVRLKKGKTYGEDKISYNA